MARLDDITNTSSITRIAVLAQMSAYVLVVSSMMSPSVSVASPVSDLQEVIVDQMERLAPDWSYGISTVSSPSRGWRSVINHQDKSARNNPSSTSRAVQWSLARTFDLSQSEAPILHVKSLFRGHQYSNFQIKAHVLNAAGDIESSTHIYQQDSADSTPTERLFTLDEIAGERVRIEFLLHKDAGVVEKKVGLYIHQVGIYQELTAIPPQVETLKVSAFNIQVFGVSKMDKPQVVSALTEILPSFDVILIQEIRDISGEAIMELMEALEALYPGQFGLVLSERLGRTRSKEQYAYIYRTDKLQFISAEVIADPLDLFERPPFVAQFRHLNSAHQFSLLGTHIDPDVAPEELDALHEIFTTLNSERGDSDEIIVLGDFNADCRYLNATERETSSLFIDAHLTSWITDELDTTTRSTDCAYDRILTTSGATEMTVDAGVFRYDEVFGYDEALTISVSDHYPVWITLEIQSH
jgi:deoxyribonuclease-1/deoxyribonuclease-1-like protein